MSTEQFQRAARAAGRAAGCAAGSAAVLAVTAPTAFAAGGPSVSGVISNLTGWLVGILAGLATLLFTIGGVRYLLAGGDPGEVRAAKETLKYAAVGYAVAALAPVLVTLLQKLVS